jgi:hypothetical protein
MDEGSEFKVDFPTLGDLIDAWITRHCRQPDGALRGSTFRLSDWQFWVIANRWRIRDNANFVPLSEVTVDNPMVLNQAFTYRMTLTVGPQKSGKGPLTAAIAAAEACGPVVFAGWAQEGDVYKCSENGCSCGWEYPYLPGEPKGMRHPSPLVQMIAHSEEQGKNIFTALQMMILLGPLKKILKVRNGFIRILRPGERDDMGESIDLDIDKIEVVTSSAKSRLGARISDAEQDETGTYLPNAMGRSTLRDAAQTQARNAAGTGGRVHLWTNAWDPTENSWAQEVYEANEDDVFIFYRNPDLEPTLKHRDGTAYRFSNARERRQILKWVYSGSPWVNIDSVDHEAQSLMKRDPAEAKRFFGNYLVQGQGSYMEPALYDSTEENKGMPPEGTEICLGFDGSKTGDWTAVRAETVDGYRFTPTYGPDDHPSYWNPKEYNDRIPYGEVDACIDELCEHYDVQRAYCDPHGWETTIDTWAQKYGEDVFVQWPTNKTDRMYNALERYWQDTSDHTTTHSIDAVARTHALNAKKVAKPGDRYMLGKPSDIQKIDIEMADVLAHEAAADMRALGWGMNSNKVFLLGQTTKIGGAHGGGNGVVFG